MVAYDELLEKNKKAKLSETERLKLKQFPIQTDQFMLCKAHAAALLRWRGYDDRIKG